MIVRRIDVLGRVVKKNKKTIPAEEFMLDRRFQFESKFRLVPQKCILHFQAHVTCWGFRSPIPHDFWQLSLRCLLAANTVLIKLCKSKGGKNGKKER